MNGKICLFLSAAAVLCGINASAYKIGAPEIASPSSVKSILSAEAVHTESSAVPEAVTLKINGSPVSGIYPAMLWNDSTIVPLRAVMEALDCSVKWDDPTQTVTITKGETEIKFSIDSDVMTVGGEKRNMSAPALLIGELTYIPLRAVSEALGASVGWEHDLSSAGICTLGKASELSIGDYKVTVGETVSELTAVCGEPTYKTIGENGLYWYVYAEYPAAFMAVATDGGIVCGYYTNSPLFSTSDGAEYGSALPSGVSEYRKLSVGGYTIEEFYDASEKILCGIYCMRNGYYNICDESVSLAGQSRIGLDILNSIRYAKNLSTLEWDDAAALCCAEHSAYMSEIGSLTHESADGSSAIERYLKYNPDFVWRAWGENICAEAKNIFTAMNGWRNSVYHRSIMLSDKTKAGIGMVHNTSGKYKYCAAMLLLK